MNNDLQTWRMDISGKVWNATYVDMDGNPVERTPIDHPYTYDSFVVWRNGDKKEATGGVYTDRLLQWDWDKHNALCRKHFGDEGQYWSDRDPELIEAFLRDWTENPNLRLIYVLQCCNQSSGFPLWYLAYAEK